MVSLQGEGVVPPALAAVIDRVRDGAEPMPRRQFETQMETEIGPDWNGGKYASLDMSPFAAASIGEVHRGEVVVEECVLLQG